MLPQQDRADPGTVGNAGRVARTIGVLGELFITAGVVLLLFIAMAAVVDQHRVRRDQRASSRTLPGSSTAP